MSHVHGFLGSGLSPQVTSVKYRHDFNLESNRYGYGHSRGVGLPRDLPEQSKYLAQLSVSGSNPVSYAEQRRDSLSKCEEPVDAK